MTLDFTPQRIADLRRRSGQAVNAILALPSETVKPNRTRQIYREFVVHNSDGQPIGKCKEKVTVNNKSSKLTILMVEAVDTQAEQDSLDFRSLVLHDAIACGFKTVQDLRDDWIAKHPSTILAKLIWFCLGDVRDKDRYLQRYISRGGDYTGVRHEAIDYLSALTEEQLEELAMVANQRDLSRIATREQQLQEDKTLAERAAHIEQVGEDLRREIKHELKIITDRTQRGLRKL